MLEMYMVFREIEIFGKLFVVVINGMVMGGGLEFCLVCYYWIVLNNIKIKLGFLELKVGLLFGGGGIVKVLYLLGI